MNLSVFCHSGRTPSLPSIPIRTSDYAQARAGGATQYVWTHSVVSSTKLEVDAGQPAPTVDFDPVSQTTSFKGLAQQIAQQGAQSGMTADEIKDEALRKGQQAAASGPTFQDSNVDPSTFWSEQLATGSGFQPSGTFRGKWIWTQVYQTKKTVTTPQPAPAAPTQKDEYVLTEDRYTFQYASVPKSFNVGSSQPVAASSGYPQPFHFDVGGQPLTSESQLDDAIKRLQYLAIAHRRAVEQPWLSGLKVSIRGVRHPVFENPSSWGLFTYAQVQVYNPTSWDLYTQDWRAKLMPATLLEQFLNSSLGGSILKGADAVLQELNAH
jgi:hypothetical protein